MLSKNLPRSQGGSGIPDGKSEQGQKRLREQQLDPFTAHRQNRLPSGASPHHGNPRKGDGTLSHPAPGKALGPPTHPQWLLSRPRPETDPHTHTSFSCFPESPPGPSDSKKPAVKGQLPSRAAGNSPANRKAEAFLVCFGESCKTSLHWGLKFLVGRRKALESGWWQLRRLGI